MGQGTEERDSWSALDPLRGLSREGPGNFRKVGVLATHPPQQPSTLHPQPYGPKAPNPELLIQPQLSACLGLGTPK